MTSRRQFMQTAAATMAISGLTFPATARRTEQQPASPSKSNKSMKLLILGGTGFIGPHIVQAALDRGHEMTLFNRGRTNVELFKDLEQLKGDRSTPPEEGLKAIQDREWDAVIDTSGYVPRIVGNSASLLEPSTGQYVFISSVSAYGLSSEGNLDESSAVATMDDETIEEVNGETYGPLKALCESRVTDTYGSDRATVIRPGYIVGPRDHTHRFTYYPVRVGRGGEMVCPGTPNDPVQIIDARDLARWVIHSIETKHTGTYNAVGPLGQMSIAEMIHGCKAVTGGDASFTWVDASFLEEQQAMMPIWVDPNGPYAGFGTVSNKKAVAAGMTYTPLAETVRDTLDWFYDQPDDVTRRLTSLFESDRESKLLEAWHAKQG